MKKQKKSRKIVLNYRDIYIYIYIPTNVSGRKQKKQKDCSKLQGHIYIHQPMFQGGKEDIRNLEDKWGNLNTNIISCY